MSCRTVPSPDAVARTVTGSPALTVPARTSSPGAASSGVASPVSRLRSIRVEPATTTPSTGRRCPAATSTMPPGATACAGTSSREPSDRTTVAGCAENAARFSAVERMAPRVLESRKRPARRKNSSIVAASKYACGPSTVARLVPAVTITAIEIGTSMLTRRAESAASAERKNGRPA